MQEARVAPIKALKDTLIKSVFLPGDIELMPATNIPTDEKFAKPQRPYKVINLDLSDSNPSSRLARL